MAKKPIVDELKWEAPQRPRQKLKFSVPIPPSSNNAFYNGRRGVKTFAKLWMSRCKAHVLQIIADENWKEEGEEVWFYIDMIFYFPDKRFRDNHNTFKIFFDGLQGTFMVNDYYIMPRVFGCYLDRDKPRVEVVITAQTKTNHEKYKNGFNKKKTNEVTNVKKTNSV